MSTSSRLGRLILYSLNRPLALVAIGLLIGGAGLGSLVLGLASWMVAAWVLVCAGLFVATVVDTLADPERERDAALADVDPDDLRDRALRDKVYQALRYVKSARKLIAEAKGGVLDSAAADLPDMESAARSIFQVAGRLQRYGGDPILRNDLANLKQKGPRLTESQKSYLETLNKLESLMKEASDQIDSALAEMGQSYASMQAILVKPEFLGTAADSFDRVREVTRRLDDISTSFDEVYGRG
ncbi:MAG: hypothetical protein HYX94_01260 [Chloroflexi bacterium]|nr:hypothetical protein [Chloroflexota bacterium]